MFKHFGDWHKIASISVSADDLQKSWSVVESISKKPTVTAGLTWVRLFGDLSSDNATLESFAKTFLDADPTFPMKNNRVRIKVLAAASIASLFEGPPSKCADAVALAVICRDCCGLSKNALISDLPTLAQEYMFRESARSRRLTVDKAKASLSTLEGSIKAVKEAGSDIAVLSAAIVEALRRVASVYSELMTTNETLSEEVEILWWVLGEHSRDTENKISELNHNEASLMVGKEFSDLVTKNLTPVSALAIMDKMLRAASSEDSKVSIKGAVESVSEEWRKRIVSEHPLDLFDLCPVHVAMQKSLESSAKGAWTDSFGKVTKIDPKGKIFSRKLALQVCNERLFARAVRAAKGG